jgi:hypothetical protein
LDALRARKAELSAEILRLALLMREIDSDIGKAILERKRRHLAEVQRSYYSIDVTRHPNVVIANLAGIIGVERTIRDDIALYENPHERKKSVDSEIALCDDLIAEKEKEDSLRRR